MAPPRPRLYRRGRAGRYESPDICQYLDEVFGPSDAIGKTPEARLEMRQCKLQLRFHFASTVTLRFQLAVEHRRFRESGSWSQRARSRTSRRPPRRPSGAAGVRVPPPPVCAAGLGRVEEHCLTPLHQSFFHGPFHEFFEARVPDRMVSTEVAAKCKRCEARPLYCGTAHFR